MQRALKIWALLLIVLAATVVEAQERRAIRLGAEHAKRLDKAVEMVRDGALEEALGLFDALLSEVELDLLYLNRGRVLQRLGQCEAAKAAFERVSTAPRLEGVNEKTILKPLGRYISELEETCPGRLAVSCKQAGMVVDLEGPKATRVRCGEEIELAAGRWTITGALHSQQTPSVAVTIKGTHTSKASVGLDHSGFVGVGRVLLGQRRFGEAQAFLEAALRIEETQETYLYIGEALMGQSQCQLAHVAMNEVKTAPPSNALSPLQVAQQIEVFRRAFRGVCGEQVRIGCVPAEMTLRIDGGTPQVCSPGTIFLSAGQHTISATLNQREGEPPQSLTREVEIKPGEINQIEMRLSDEALLGALGWAGVVGMGLGLTSLTSALLVDRLVLSPLGEDFDQDKLDGVSIDVLAAQLEEIETYQTTSRTLTGAGAALLLMGGGLLVTDIFFMDSSPDAQGEGVSLMLSPDGLVMVWGTVWP